MLRDFMSRRKILKGVVGRARKKPHSFFAVPGAGWSRRVMNVKVELYTWVFCKTVFEVFSTRKSHLKAFLVFSN